MSQCKARNSYVKGHRREQPQKSVCGQVCDPLSAMEYVDELGELELTEELVGYLLAAPSQPPSVADNPCWGGLLQGSSAHCSAGFEFPSGSHFKDRVCPRCRSEGVRIPLDRLRALGPCSHENAHSTGLWTTVGDQMCRVVNQTAKCTGPRLLIYRDPQPAAERAAKLYDDPATFAVGLDDTVFDEYPVFDPVTRTLNG